MGIHATEAFWSLETEGSELVETTIGDVLDRQAEAFGDKIALVFAYPEIGLDLRLGYRTLRDRADETAKGLMALGVRAGAKVAVMAPNLPEWVLLQMALPRLGAVLVTVNPQYRQDELAYLLAQADVDTLVLVAEHRGIDHLASLRSIVPSLERIADPASQDAQEEALPLFRRAILIGAAAESRGLVSFDSLADLGRPVSDAELRARQAVVMPCDVAQIQFTSGTTGSPKGAMITHRGMINNARFIARRAGLGSDDRFVTAMPMFHTAGNVVDQLSMLVTGGTVIKAIAFEPSKMLELIDRERGTVIDAVPTMIIEMLREPRFGAGQYDLSSLRQVITGGTPIPVALMEEIQARWGAQPTIVFGMTEASPIITQTRADDSFERRSSTVGQPLPFVEIRIADSEGRTLAHGERGEILIRGYNVTPGYYKMPEQTARTIDADGWLHSGDLGSMDGEGVVRILGRIKDMLIRGGENVYPAEIEEVLIRHPAIRQAAVVGVADERLGEEAAALLQLELGAQVTEEEVQGWCRERLSRHKVPRYIRFVEAFPMTPSGKLKKFEMRARLERELAQLDATPVLTDAQGAVLTITLNRVSRHNALTPELVCRLADAFRAFEEDPTLQVAVLTGAGRKAFCAGGDLGDMLPLLTGDRAPRDEWDRRVLEEPEVMALSSLRDHPVRKPIIAAINGLCLAGGAELILGTDIRIAAEGAIFGFPEVKWGLVPFAGAMVRLARQIPQAAAMHLLLSGESIDAAEACRIGLVNRVVPASQLLAQAQALARTIAANGPLAVRRAKQTVLETSGRPLSEAYEIENETRRIVLSSEDAREGPRAFVLKRPPVFVGR